MPSEMSMASDVITQVLLTDKRTGNVLREHVFVRSDWVGYYDPPCGTLHLLEPISEADVQAVLDVLTARDNRTTRKISRPPPIAEDEHRSREQQKEDVEDTVIWLPTEF